MSAARQEVANIEHQAHCCQEEKDLHSFTQ